MARKFEFRLEVVRDMRKRSRDEVARRVALQIAASTATRRRLDNLSLQADSEAQSSRANRGEKTLDIPAIRVQQLHGKWLGRRVEEASAELQRVEAGLAAERSQLIQATARLKAIERLRERRWQRHLVAVRREEQAVMDEVAIRMRMNCRTNQEEGSS